jgi:hypothetical protein
MIRKIGDEKGRASEWDVAAALLASVDATVINISFAFGLGDRACDRCGRESGSSRSSVFEGLLEHVFPDDRGVVIVAAAGNRAQEQLSYPARFARVIAVMSLNKARQLSTFSNRGERDHRSLPHPCVVATFGGDNEGPQPEGVGRFEASSRHWCGTSFAAATVSGLAARLSGSAQSASARARAVKTFLRGA